MEYYPRVLVELVGIVGVVLQNNDDEVLVAVVVGPVSISGSDCDHIALFQEADLLMTIGEFLAPHPLFRRLLGRLEGFGAPGDGHSINTTA